jgi:hypothetical protein
MSDARAKELIDLGDRLFTRKDPLNNLMQEIAENFYCERADFTSPHNLGDDFAAHLMDSYPVLMRRELGNNISAMLRPRDRQWFRQTTLNARRDKDPVNARYLEWAAETQKAQMYDSRTGFIRATKEGDHDFVTFGQAVLSVEESKTRDHLFYRTFHIRDCAWLENDINEIDHLHRKDKMTARKMKAVFKEAKLDQAVKKACKENPGQEFNVRCIVMPADEYDYTKADGKKNGRKLPFVCIYVDADNCRILKEGGLADFNYVVPRWHTISGWQYAFSPATTIALPDARMVQMMARIILESGEKFVDPPLAADAESIREANIQAGAMTWVDLQGDRKIADVIQPLITGNGSNMGVAFQMRQDMREMLTKAWFIEKLTLPPASGSEKMTAEEVRVRQDEFIRNLLPLFEPMEIEYNTRILDKSFNALRNMGVFKPEDVPDDLLGADTTWAFESPLQTASRRAAIGQFQEVLGLIAQSAQAELGLAQGGTRPPVRLDLALKDAIYGTSAPSTWMKTDDEIAEENAAAQEEIAGGQLMSEVASAAEVAGSVADASQKVGQAMLPPQVQQGARKALPAPKKAA